MPGDETVFEGPATPAPVFAYRAIRGIFFASPDSSPEHDNKENVAPALYTSSPLKPKATMDGALQLTPSQKRKRDSGGAILSPTKGILRTPGLPTPRAKYLKDVNVKFKSVSPEALGTNIYKLPVADHAVVARVPPKAKEPGHAVRPSKSTSDLTDVKKSQPSKQKPKKPVPTQPSQPSAQSTPALHTGTANLLSAQAIEAYMQQTEKEMKKLVRYGQRMREYAHQKDAEAQDLKGIIELLQRENERLRQAASVVSESGFQQTRGRESGDTKAISRGYVCEELGRVETTIKRQLAPRQQDSARATEARPPNQPSGQPSADPSRSDHLIDQVHAYPLPHRAPAGSLRHASTATTTSTAATSSRLPPDRLAAARARLRQRSEARKASAETQDDNDNERRNENDVRHEIQPTDEAQNASREQSVLDWVNL